MNEQTNERMDGWMDRRMNERTNERMDRRMNEQTNERMDGWMARRMNERTNERMDEWKNKPMKEWMNEPMKGWMDVQVNKKSLKLVNFPKYIIARVHDDHLVKKGRNSLWPCISET